MAKSHHDAISESPISIIYPNVSTILKEDSPLLPTDVIDSIEKPPCPDGGVEAWLVVFGSFSGFLCSLSMINSIGTYQSWLATHELRNYSPSAIGWIFSTHAFNSWFVGLFVGPIFDAQGPQGISFIGGILLLVMYFGLSFCQTYTDFFLCIGVIGGTANACLFTCAVSIIQHWFSRRRGLAMGLAISGASVGGITFPFLLGHLLPRLGFATSTRIVTLILLPFVLSAIFFLKSRVNTPTPSSSVTTPSWLPNLRILSDPLLIALAVALTCNEMAIYLPVTYIATQVMHFHSQNATLANNTLMLYSIGGLVGRWLPGLLPGTYRPITLQHFTLTLMLASILLLWLPSGSSIPMLRAFVLTFGLSSGSYLTLEPLCIAEFCTTDEYGRYVTTVYMLTSFGSLIGIPLGGKVLEAGGGHAFEGLALLAAGMYTCALALFVLVRIKKKGVEGKEGSF